MGLWKKLQKKHIRKRKTNGIGDVVFRGYAISI